MFNQLYLANQITYIYVLYIFQYVLLDIILSLYQIGQILFAALCDFRKITEYVVSLFC